jgi:hypothetical protein
MALWLRLVPQLHLAGAEHSYPQVESRYTYICMETMLLQKPRDWEF